MREAFLVEEYIHLLLGRKKTSRSRHKQCLQNFQQSNDEKLYKPTKVKQFRTTKALLQHFQHTHAGHQLVQHCRCDLLQLDRDKRLCGNPPVRRNFARVRCEQQRTKWLAQSSDDAKGSHLYVSQRYRCRGWGRWCFFGWCGTPSSKRLPKASSEPTRSCFRGFPKSI